ncbi:MAG: transcriptional repressor LexA, partial [Luteimonas sp.]
TYGMPPTIAEIAHAFGLASATTAVKHLKRLEDKGWIELMPNVARGIRLLGKQKNQATGLSLPLIGRVAAGLPILSEDLIERDVVVDRHLFRPHPKYLLRVHGMSMRDAGILDGDLIGVKPTPDAEHGQIVVARLGDEGITVKRLYRRGRSVRLIAANPEFGPIDPDPTEDFAIEGLYCGLLRSL